MNGLKTSRVVIIDNDPKDIFPIFMGLSSQGVALTAFHVDEDYNPPSEKITGVRIVFLDLRLGSGGMGGINSGDFREALGKLDEIIQLESELTGIICWSNHAEHTAEVKKLLETDIPDFTPAFIEGLDKKEYKEEPEALIKEIHKLISTDDNLSLHLSWEQAVHRTTSRVSSSLKSRPDIHLRDIQAAMVKGVIGSRACKSPEEYLSAYFEAMNSIMLDDLSGHESELPSGLKSLFEKANEPTSLAYNMGPNLNSLSLIDKLQLPCRTGNVFLDGQLENFPFTFSDSDKRKILYTALLTKDQCNDKAFKKRSKAFFSKAICCVVDITPSCDYAQGKETLPRLVCGFLVKLGGLTEKELPVSVTASARDYAREFGPFQLEKTGLYEEGIYKIVLNARYLAVVNERSFVSANPAFRIRKPVMVDFAAWLASHIARPGYIKFT